MAFLEYNLVDPGSSPVYRITQIATRRSLMDFPGNCATPRETARWLAWVAENEFGLPGMLPVMTVAVELTTALTSEGCLDDIPGYFSAVDHASLGLFQQQPPWWGTPEEIVDPDYAVRAFCKEAAKYKDWGWNTKSADELGRWCAMVQNPREDLRDQYATKGYPIAKKLLEEEVPVIWPQIQIAFDSVGWAYDPTSKNWLRSDRPLDIDKDGWVFSLPADEPEEKWQWPEANDPPRAGNYEDRHPTRYTWRDDVEKIARYLVNTYDVWCNTYLDHPEGYSRDVDSIDIWGPDGRDDSIDPAVGQEVFNLLFNDPGKPDIDWIIWQAWIWTHAGGWAPFGTDDFSWHYDHIHCTYLP